MNLVVVESPAKAKTINKYLGSDFKVLASFGHIRDLPSKDGSVDPDNGFSMLWDVDGRSEKHIREIATAAKKADAIYLATDPDREGEAISWHILDVLTARKALGDKPVKRVVFHEITKHAVIDAVENPRQINNELVEAYLARRALDYLVGFNLSPVLWRKLPGARSAGRVQSVALRLICEREAEIEGFTPREYWSLEADFQTPSGQVVPARLTHLNGRKLDKFDLGDAQAATAAKAEVERHGYRVATVEKKSVKRNPQPPFTTSTLQQEASRKLGFGAKRTMQVAQKLYEGVDIGGETVGLITYMRTDSVALSQEALSACRNLITASYGDAYLPDAPRRFTNKSKNAQEAHEAIRPTDVSRNPTAVAGYLDADQRKLYELIWKRTVASQMERAVFDQVSVDIAALNAAITFRATGSVITFDGFLTLYQEGRDDAEGEDEKNRRLPKVSENDAMALTRTEAEQHFTQPPPRYSEASLVKRLEELGIGRPSTYASIISVLQDRDYVALEKRRFVPQERGRLVTAFLTKFFERYVQYNFTAELENELDDIANGKAAWKQVLTHFWQPFKGAVDEAKELQFADVLTALEADLAPFLFPPSSDGSDPRACPKCADGRLSLKLGRFGAFLGCSNYPDCRHTRPVGSNGDGPQGELDEPKLLGTDPDTGKAVSLRKGPYGVYVQLGEEETVEGKNGKPKKVKPKRASLPKGMDPTVIDLAQALNLLSLPREVGRFPETGETILANIGRFGPYVQAAGVYASLSADDDVLTIGENRAIALIQAKREKAGKAIGAHPEDGKPVMIADGRWGAYVKHGRVNATLPKDMDKADVTLEVALKLLAAKQAGKKGAAKKPAAKKATPKKTAGKKAAAKKPAAKKGTGTRRKKAAAPAAAEE